MSTVLKIVVHAAIFVIAFAVFIFGLGVGLAWEEVTLAGVTLSGPTAGTALWIGAGLIALCNIFWMVKSFRGRS